MKVLRNLVSSRASQTALLLVLVMVLGAGASGRQAEGSERIDTTFAKDGFWVEEDWGDLLIKRDSKGRILVLDPWRSTALTRLMPGGAVDSTFGFGQSHTAYPDPGGYFTKYQWGLSPVLRNGVDPLVAARLGSGGPSTALSAMTERGRLSMHFFDAGLVGMMGFDTGAILPGPDGATLMAGQLNVKWNKPGIAVISKIDRGSNLIDSFGKNGQIRIRAKKHPNQVPAHQFSDISYVNGGLLATAYLNGHLVLLKYDRRGKPVWDYGTGGRMGLDVRSHWGCSGGCMNVMSVDHKGSGFIAGNQGKRGRDVIVSVNGPGTIRRSFGGDGQVDLDTLLSRKWTFALSDLELDGNGVLVAGNLWSPVGDEGRADSRGVLVRLDSTGKLDTRFGENGVFRFPELTIAASIEKTRDGVIVGGHIQPIDHRTIFGVVTKVLVDN